MSCEYEHLGAMHFWKIMERSLVWRCQFFVWNFNTFKYSNVRTVSSEQSNRVYGRNLLCMGGVLVLLAGHVLARSDVIPMVTLNSSVCITGAATHIP